MYDKKFPDGFLWGAATAALQIEGSPHEDGGGESSWEHFTRQPGAILNDDVLDVACDHFHRYREDIRLMKELGLTAYRFSIPWSRTIPDGKGKPNSRSLDFYQRLIDELLANGIEPFVTLFHWETPQAMEELGGWRNKETSYASGEHAAFVVRHLSDRVRHFFTINEAMCFAESSYGAGVHAPGLKLGRKVALQTMHNAFLAHGVMLAAIRANAKPGCTAGIVENCLATVPAYESAENNLAARTAFRYANANRLVPVMEGAYPDFFLKAEGDNAPEFTDGEMKLIGAPLDQIGLNIYSGEHGVADASRPSGWRTIPFPPGYPMLEWDWLRFEPRAIYWALRHIVDLWPGPDLFIAENGCPTPDRPSREDGRVYDSTRVMYLRHHLELAQRATAEGIPLKGYFVWSLLDNFEWAWGYTKRFGLFHVNFNTQQRTPKLSADFYRNVIRQNAVC